MRHSLGRRTLEVTWTFILTVTLLLPGVTSRAFDVTTITSTSVRTSRPYDGVLEKEPANRESGDHNSEVLTYLRRDINETETTDLGYFPVVNNGTETDDEIDEDDALALFSLIVKRAVEEEMEDSEEGKPETNSVDEDTFSISDLPKLLKPVIDAFSDSANSEAPSKDDFLSWFPSLKDLFEPSKPSGSEVASDAARAGRRSGFTTPLTTSPTSAQPTEPEKLPSSHLVGLMATVPSVTRPPIIITNPRVPVSKRPVTIPSTDDSDSEEDSKTDS